MKYSSRSARGMEKSSTSSLLAIFFMNSFESSNRTQTSSSDCDLNVVLIDFARTSPSTPSLTFKFAFLGSDGVLVCDIDRLIEKGIENIDVGGESGLAFGIYILMGGYKPNIIISVHI